MPNPFEAQVREMLARGMKDEEIVAALTGKSQTTTASAEQSPALGQQFMAGLRSSAPSPSLTGADLTRLGAGLATPFALPFIAPDIVMAQIGKSPLGPTAIPGKIAHTVGEEVSKAPGKLAGPISMGLPGAAEGISRQLISGKGASPQQLARAATEGLAEETIGRATGVALGGAQAAPGFIKGYFRGELPRLQAFKQLFNKVVGNLAGEEAASKRAVGVYDTYRQSLNKDLKKEGAKSFLAAEAEGGHISPQRYHATIDEEIAREAGKGEFANQRKLIELKLLREQSSEVLSPRELQGGLETWGERSRGSGDFWKDIDSASQRRVAKRLFGALKDDLSTSAAEGRAGAKSLQTARDTYRAMAEELEGAKSYVLEKALGKAVKADAPDMLARGILKFEPAQITQAITILEKIEPKAADELRSAAIQHMASKYPATAKKGLVDPKGLVRWADANAAEIEALYGSDKVGYKKLSEVVEVARELAKTGVTWQRAILRAAFAGGPIGGFGYAVGGATGASVGATAGVTASLVPALKRILARRNLFSIISDPEGKELFLRLVKPKHDLLPVQSLGGILTKLVSIGEASEEPEQHRSER